MEIIFATGNEHKLQELKEILKGYTLRTPKDLGIEFDCEETGETYFDNALLKANYLYDKVKMPVIADDSGLSVPALQGAPGVYSARYGSKEFGRMLSAEERNGFLLNNMKEIQNREAFFVCSMIFLQNPYCFYAVQETLEGEITQHPAGTGGFGYDPIFFLKSYDCTLAEVGSKVKNEISHRAKAGIGLRAILDRLKM